MASNIGATSHKQLMDDIDEKILLCPICQERFTSPKILPCVHTFCEKCLKSWIEKKHGKLTCPSCRKPHVIPPGGVRALNNNLFINEMLEMFSKVKIGQDVLKCDVCASAASFWCKDCVEFFCKDCSVQHSRMRLSKTHKVITVEEYQELEKSDQRHLIRPRFCTNHPNNQLELFCDLCQVTACIKCGMIDHKGIDHKMISMEDAVNKYSPNLHSLTDKLERAVTSLISCKDKHEQVKKQLKRKQISVEQEIKQHAANITKRVKQEEQRLLAKVTEICGKQDKELQAQMEHIELDLGRAKSMQSYAINFLHHGNPADFLSQKQNLEVGLTELGHTSLLTQYGIRTDIKFKFQESVSPHTLSIGEVNCERTESSPQREVECRSNVITGKMPHGTLNVKVVSLDDIIIDYNIPDGVQGSEHPNPGQPYRGMQLKGWLRGDDEGRELLRLLKIAFDRRLTFTIGKDNTVTENGITHNKERFFLLGIRWNEYCRQLRQQLAAKGIK